MISKSQLSNGLTVLYHETPNDPIAACHLFIPNGNLHDPQGKRGLTTLHWSLFTKGTKKRNARMIAEDVEMLGASIGAGATYDYSEVSCHATSDLIQKTLEASAECLFEPLFDENEIQKEKTALQAAIRSKRESIFTITHEKMALYLYPNHPYGHPGSGTEESVGHINKGDLVKRHHEMVQPVGAVMAMACNIPFKTMEPILESLFGSKSWPALNLSESGLSIKQAVPPQNSEDLTCHTHFEQAYLMIGFSAAAVDSNDYVPLKVINGILGGGMSTRLFQTLREKEGLAYDVGSFYATKKYGSSFVFHMGLQPAKLEEAKQGIFREIKKLKNEPVPEVELSQVKNQMRGGYILDHQTNSQRAHYMGWWEILGPGAGFDLVYPGKIQDVTSDLIHKTVDKYFSGPSITVETVPEPVSHAR